MHRLGFPKTAALAAGLAALSWTAPVPAIAADQAYRLTGPYTHGNLAIYPIHRDGREDGPVPLTLGEAMERGAVRVIETGDVEELVVRNRGDREVFIQTGDIVKGGKQDRVLTVSMIVPPNSGDIAIGAFCVEQGRWEGRGSEKGREFSASTARLPSKAGRIALYYRSHRGSGVGAGGSDRTRTGRRLPEGDDLQGRVWASVRETQTALSGAMMRPVADERSRSSLQLSLEHKALGPALQGYEEALGKLAEERPDAVGYVFAVGGRIDGGDEFASPGLFRKVWLRQLRAAATAALASGDAPESTQPTLTEVAAFIDRARSGRSATRILPARTTLETRETKTALFTQMSRPAGGWVHRSFIAR